MLLGASKEEEFSSVLSRREKDDVKKGDRKRCWGSRKLKEKKKRKQLRSKRTRKTSRTPDLQGDLLDPRLK